MLGQASEAYFEVQNPGRYRIHTLIAELTDPSSPHYLPQGEYSPNGQRRLQDLEASLQSRCADLDMVGTGFFAASDLGIPCLADAGILEPGFAQLDAAAQQVRLVPSIRVSAEKHASREHRYLLVRGTQGPIIAMAESPEFFRNLQDTGLYILHSLVAELNDPQAANYMDVNWLLSGQLRIDDLINHYVQRDLCARVSVIGAPVYVPDQLMSGRCAAEAGRTKLFNVSPMDPGRSVLLEAEREVAAFLPDGHSLYYLLTEGPDERIINWSGSPSFEVDRTGSYGIRSFVVSATEASDPDYFDMSRFGSENLHLPALRNLLFQQGICSDIEEQGAQFVVNGGVSSTHDAAPQWPLQVLAEAGQWRIDLNNWTAGSESGWLRHYDLMGRLLHSQEIAVQTGASASWILPKQAVSSISVVQLQLGARQQSIWLRP